MILERINLKDHFPSLENDVYLETYCPSNFNEWSLNEKRKGLLILPGGGYDFLSEREAEPIALRFSGHNIASFVLKYTINPKIKFPFPLIEVYAAICYLRRNKEKYHLFEDKISVLGFSAGGHLAASSSCYHKNEEYAKLLGINIKEMEINGCLLAYPVISTTFGHERTIENFTAYNPELLKKFSIDKNVTEDFPKTFIWHTTFDTLVNVKNSISLIDALYENKIFFEAHIYPMHDHGQALCDESVFNTQTTDKKALQEMKYNTQWVDNAIHFIKEYI